MRKLLILSFFSEDTPSPTFLEKIQGKVEKALFFRNLQRENIDPSQIDKAQERVKISLTNFSGDKSSEAAGWIKLIFGSMAGYLLMIFIVVYGNMIMRSVIEEKVNRIVEVIISSVPARTLLLGKIIGTSLVASPSLPSGCSWVEHYYLFAITAGQCTRYGGFPYALRFYN